MTRIVPWIFAVSHASLLVYMLANIQYQPYPGPKVPGELSFSSWHMATGMMVAGRDIHHDPIGKFLVLTDLPVVLVVSIPELLIRRVVSPMTASYVFAGEWLLLGSAWWFAVPWYIARQFGKPKVGKGVGAA